VQQVTIVSNRLPISVKKADGKLQYYPSLGGLATGLSSYANSKNSKWIGWPGIASDDLTETEKQKIAKKLALDNCFPVFLSKKQLDTYYNGYSNGILWPFFHNTAADYDHQEQNWRAYKEVNAIFTDAVISMTGPKSTVWVHDYQLMLLPGLLRSERPYSTIGFFLHIPFPATNLVVKLPHAKRLMGGLLGSDLVGFQTAKDVRSFLDTCAELNVGLPSPNGIVLADRVVRVTDFPISIDYAKHADASNSKEVLTEVKRLRKLYGTQKIILTVDRLDPSKGLVERVQAYRTFLESNPKMHDKVIMVMLANPSRTDIPAYKQLKIRLEALISDTNELYKEGSWEPIHYMYDALPFEKVAALFQVADVAFIAPLKDGMNLVAKEYIASKQNKNGVLILSETAGAAQELTDAIIVNPLQNTALAKALAKALTMPTKEIQKRAAQMQNHISTHTIQHWAGGFMKSLQKAQSISLSPTIILRMAMQDQLINNYLEAKKRLILLDYDGVLSPFFGDPGKAKPSDRAYEVLTKLSLNQHNKVVIISGRSKNDLENWFGKLPIALAAEHGALIRESGHGWHQVVNASTYWKAILKPILEKYARLTPGAFVEEKETSLVWHHRKASPYYAQKNIVVLRRALTREIKKFGVRIYSGNKILEIKSPDANKGAAIQRWLDKHYDFVMAIGDDYTDEDMFTVLEKGAYSVKVGRGKTRAGYRLNSVADAIGLLEQMAKS
jgi:trehalose 6-phosphate synthase/phosphatase